MQTAEWLGAVQLILVTLLLSTWYLPITFRWCVAALAVLQLLVALAVAVSARRQLRSTRLPQDLPEISDGQLPTVTIAVPVRNEGEQLEACLTSLLASNYPKLEILAFDDQSTDRTPDIIRQYAHAGVRFLRSEAHSVDWLAKNQAYDQLAQAASGELLLFCGADIRLDSRSLRQLVALMKYKQKTMLTILPQNRLLQRIPLLQAMRYYWEVAPPRRLFNRPPVLSSCWLINRETLQKAGGFAAVRRSVTPEAYLARYTALHNDGYSFMHSNHDLGVWFEKSDHDQRETALMRRYPQVHRRPEMVMMFGIGQAFLLLGPVLTIVAAVMLGIGWVAILASVALILHSTIFGIIQQSIFIRAAAWRAYVALLPAIVLDVWYLHRSMYHYEFGRIHWKGRSISRPVMTWPGDWVQKL
jgi:glycosyltransferase involved in cell wall biosynthesis